MRGPRKNLAIAGCGVQSKEHFRVLTKIDSINLIALCDMNGETASKTAKEWNVKHYYTNFSEMLKGENVSIVSILTPPQAHAAMAIEAIRSGTNVLLEKPFATTTEEAESILRALRENPVKLTLNYNALLSDTMMKALDMVNLK